MESLIAGFFQIFNVETILWIALGEVLGIILGALPGLTATMGVALMLPISYRLPDATGMALLLGVYCGAVSGASIPAILLGIPGNPNAIATVYDGQAMTKKGLAGKALGGAVIASFIGGIGSLTLLVLFSPLIARFTLLFGPAEKATLALVGLTIIASVSSENLAKGVLTGTLGLMLSLFGTDPFTNSLRIPFPELLAKTPLASGINLIPALIGLFGISQAIFDLERIKQGRIAPLLGVRMFPKVLSVPPAVLIPIILILSLIGSYAIQGRAILSATFDMGVALFLGVVGYFLKKQEYPIAPIVLGLILGGMLEENFRRAVKLAGGNYFVFFTKPIALAFIVFALFSILFPFLKKRKNP
ncbi:MAG: tripartite tricarboxylate transporter permease [Deltaproteobacteria bacterium]|nr:tripartite tricarboxylate transporter permease [Deltaproteobacteria bacterium]MBW2153356.1 tripartite tricarboxylate transporter permease [Deltaproteobacteria bacterium]